MVSFFGRRNKHPRSRPTVRKKPFGFGLILEPLEARVMLDASYDLIPKDNQLRFRFVTDGDFQQISSNGQSDPGRDQERGRGRDTSKEPTLLQTTALTRAGYVNPDNGEFQPQFLLPAGATIDPNIKNPSFSTTGEVKLLPGYYDPRGRGALFPLLVAAGASDRLVTIPVDQRVSIPNEAAVPFNIQGLSTKLDSVKPLTNGGLDVSWLTAIPGIGNGAISVSGSIAKSNSYRDDSAFTLRDTDFTNVVAFDRDANGNSGPFVASVGGLDFQFNTLRASFGVNTGFDLTGTATTQFSGGSFQVSFPVNALRSFGGGVNFLNEPAPVQNLNLGGQDFRGAAQGLFPFRLTFDAASSRFRLAGEAQTKLPSDSDQTLFFGMDPKDVPRPAPAITITNGALDTVSFPVGTITYRGLTFLSSSNPNEIPEVPLADRLAATYDQAAGTMVVRGKAVLQGGNFSGIVSLGTGATAGAVVKAGSLTQIGFEVAQLKVGGLTYKPKAVGGTAPMAAIFDVNRQAFTFLGGATILDGAAEVELGTHGTTGLLLDSAAKVVQSTIYFSEKNSLSLAGVALQPAGLIGLFDPVTRETRFSGQTSMRLAGITIPISGSGNSWIVSYPETGPLTSNFRILGAFSAQPLEFKPAALFGRYDGASDRLFLEGTGATVMETRVLDVTFAAGSGAQIVGGVLQSIEFTTSALNVNNLLIASTSSGGFRWTYEVAALAYAIQGNFTYVSDGFTLGPIDGNFAFRSLRDANKKEFTQVGTLTFSQAVTLDTLSFEPGKLAVTFDFGKSNFTFKGQGQFYGKPIDIGGPGQSSVSFERGLLKFSGFNPPPDKAVEIPNTSIPIEGLAKDDQGDGTTAIKGKTSFRVGSSVLSIDLGAGGTRGLVVRGSDTVSIEGKIEGSFVLRNAKFIVKDLTFSFDVASKIAKITGTASLEFKASNQKVTVDVRLGDEENEGLVIADGEIAALQADVSADFKLFGIEVDIKKLGVIYRRDQGEFGLYGSVALSTPKKGGTRVLDDFGVSLGAGPDAPGVLIVNGALQQLDIQLNGTLNLRGVTAESKELRLRFDAGKNLLQITGGLEVKIAKRFTGEVSLSGDGLLIDTNNGEVQLKGLTVRVADIQFGKIGIEDLAFTYEQDDDTGESKIGGSGRVSLPKGITVSAGFEIVNGDLRKISVGFEKLPGIAVGKVGFITGIFGEFNNLDDLAKFEFNGRITGTIGPGVKIFNRVLAFATLEGTVSINSDRLEITGNIRYLDGLYGTGKGRATISFNGGDLVDIDADTTLYPGGLLRGRVAFKLDTDGNVTFRGGLGLFIPEGIPRIGGKELGSFEVYFQIRPNESRENSFAEVKAQVRILIDLKVSVKVDFTGRLQGVVEVPDPFPNIRFSFYLPGTRSIELDNANGITEVFHTRDGGDVIAPTLAIISAQPQAGTPFADIQYVATTALANTTIDFYADTSSSGYQGRLIAQDISYQPGQQQFIWQHLAEFAPLPYDTNRPIYVYGVIKDGSNQPVYTAYSSALTPPNYAPTLETPSSQSTAAGGSVVFSADLSNAIVVSDPLMEYLPETQLAVVVHAYRGTLVLQGEPEGLGIDGAGTDSITLTGTAGAINAALEGLIYQSVEGAIFDDKIEVRVGRTPLDPVAQLRRIIDIHINPLTLRLANPHLGNPNYEGDFSAPTTVSYEAGSGSAALLAHLIVDDVAGGYLISARIAIDGSVPGQDWLSLPVDAQRDTGLSVSFDRSTGVLRLSGYASTSTYQEAINRVLFATTSNATGKVLSISVSDEMNETAQLSIPIEIALVNQAPVVQSAGQGLVFVQGFAAAAVAPGIVVSDPENGQITSAALGFTHGTYVAGEDQLLFEAQNGITGQFDHDTGTLILHGSATAEQYTQALQSIRYFNAAANITPGLRELTLVVADDGDINSTALARLRVLVTTVLLTPPPSGAELVLTATPVQADLDMTPVTLDPELTLADTYVITMLGADVAITTNYRAGEDFLQAETLFEGIQQSFDAETGILHLTGEASTFAYQLALGSVSYINLSEMRSTGPRTLTFRVNDGLAAGSRPSLTVLVPVRPVVEVGAGLLVYERGQESRAIAPALRVVYGEGVIDEATVSIDGNFQVDEDVLEFADQNGITGDYDPALGILNLSGTASVADYEAALRSVRYRNLRRNPTEIGRAVSFEVRHGDFNSHLGEVIINVDTVDVPPTLTLGSAAELTFIELAAPLSVSPAFTIQDADAAASGQEILYGAEVSIDYYVAGEDLLGFTTTDAIRGEFDRVQGVLYLHGVASEAEYQAILRSVTYQNVSEAPTTTTRMLTILIDDGAADSLAEVSVTIHVQSHANPPTRTAGSVGSLHLLENAGPVSLGLGGLAYAPPSGREPVLVFKVTQVPSVSLGTIEFVDGVVAQVGMTFSLVQLRGARFVPVAGARGEGAFSFQVAAFNSILQKLDPAMLQETVGIAVEGVPAATPNAAFVAQLYRDLLGRNVDPAGLNFWSTGLSGALTPTQLALNLQNSPEHLAAVVRELYQSFLHRAADDTGLSFWVDQVGGGATIDQVRSRFAASAEFGDRNARVRDFVNSLYSIFLGRQADSTGSGFWEALLTAGTSPQQVALNFSLSDEALQQRVAELYQHLLRRQADSGGLAYFRDLIRTSGEGAVSAEILASLEYYDLFAYADNGQARANVDAVEQANPVYDDAAPTQAFPAVGALLASGRLFAGGTLIASRYLLTAGHVVDGRDPASLTVQLGGQTYGVAAVFVHPNYDPAAFGTDNANDIAILQLDRAVDNVAPAPLLRVAPKVGDVLTLVGFGSRTGSPGVKHAGPTPIDGVSERLVTWTFDNLTETDTVTGDSGAPELLRRGHTYYVAAVTSGGTDLASGLGDRAYNTRVDHYLAWIDAIAGTAAPTAADALLDERFVKALYQGLLGRSAQAGEVEYWIDRLNDGQSRGQVAAEVSSSREFNQTIVDGLFGRYLQRGAEPEAIDYFAGQLGAGTRVEEVGAFILNSPEYRQSRGATNRGVLEGVFRDVLGRHIEPTAAAWFAQASDENAVYESVSTILHSPEARQTQAQKLYQQILGKVVSEHEVAELSRALQQGQRLQEAAASVAGSERFFDTLG